MMLIVDVKPQFLPHRVLSTCCLGVFMSWQLNTSPGKSKPGDQGRHIMPFMSQLRSQALSSGITYWPCRPGLISYKRGWHKVWTPGGEKLDHWTSLAVTDINRVCYTSEFYHKGLSMLWGFCGGPVVKNLPCKARDTALIPGTERSHMPWSN